MRAVGSVVSGAFARDRWAAGPARLTDDELEDRRYRLTALLDDLADETNPADRAALAAAVFTDVADLALVTRGLWSGAGTMADPSAPGD
jgi:hypothetical protein